MRLEPTTHTFVNRSGIGCQSQSARSVHEKCATSSLFHMATAVPILHFEQQRLSETGTVNYK